jgi:hypothetical protein
VDTATTKVRRFARPDRPQSAYRGGLHQDAANVKRRRNNRDDAGQEYEGKGNSFHRVSSFSLASIAMRTEQPEIWHNS